MKYLILLLAFAGLSFSAYSQNCLKLLPNEEYNSWFNPDSVKIDTCTNSPTYEKWYSKYGYAFGILNYLFKPSPIQISARMTWQDIDSLYDTQRQQFEILEQKFGKFTIRRHEEHTNDSMHLAHPVFVIDFDNYNLVDSVVFYMKMIDSILCPGLKNQPYATSVNFEQTENSYNKIQIISNTNNNLIVLLPPYKIKKTLIIDIFDLLGNQIQHLSVNYADEIEINIGSIRAGMYFLRIDNKFFKFIKY